METAGRGGPKDGSGEGVRFVGHTEKRGENRGNTDPLMEADLHIRGGTLVSMVENTRPLSDASVYVKDGVIVAITTSEAEPSAVIPAKEVIDATGGLIMPGLINAHTHAAMTLFRGFSDDLPLRTWLHEKIFPAEAKFLSEEAVYWGTLLGCLEMISSGTTGFVDGYFYQDAAVRAAKEAGMRGLLAQGVVDFPAPGVEDPRENLKTAGRFLERWSGDIERIVPGIFCHSPLSCSEGTLKRASEMSKAYRVPLQMHLSETRDEVDAILKGTGKRPVFYLDGLGVLDNPVIAVHAVHVDAEEMKCLKENGVRVVHAPESNMKLASGYARVWEMLEMGLDVGLGTDGCASNNNMDLFQEMDSAAKLSKVMRRDPVVMDARRTLAMATTGGAAIMGRQDEIGTLEVGKKADVVVLDLRAPHLIPVYDPVSTIVYAADGGDVKDVVVDGRVLMRDRRFTCLDVDGIMKEVQRLANKIRP